MFVKCVLIHNQPKVLLCRQQKTNSRPSIIAICDSVLVTGPASTRVKIFKGIVIERRYLETLHKEVDVIVPRQVVDAAAQGPT